MPRPRLPRHRLISQLACSTVLRSIELCTIATEHNKDALHTGWHIGLAALSFFRRWIFLSALSVSVPMLVLYRGGDTLSICFNSVVSQDLALSCACLRVC